MTLSTHTISVVIDDSDRLIVQSPELQAILGQVRQEERARCAAIVRDWYNEMPKELTRTEANDMLQAIAKQIENVE